MADSIPGPWICDYLIEVAERHGGKVYEVPFCDKRKKVQLTEFLTFHENSYVWACISDKIHRIPVRISREGVEDYKAQNSREIVDCRFAVVFIKNFRPIFTPRPLGANQKGNTPISHIALEVGHVKLVGSSGHVFCDPKDVESNPSVKEWVLGLREDGGGGNVLKLRKQGQQAPVVMQSLPPQRPSSPTSHEPQSAHAREAVLPKAAMNDVNSIPLQSRSINLRREHAKRWRAYEIDRWKFARKPQQQEAAANLEAGPTIVSTDPAQVLASTTPLISRTPLPESPKALVPQTPSVWSPSQRGSLVQHEESRASPSRNAATGSHTSELHSDLEIEKPTEEVMDHVHSSRSCSPRPPTPAQRNGRVSPNIRSPSSSLPPSNAFPFPSSPTNLRMNVKRRVPAPEVLPMRDPNHSGPTQILVPNSDPSATTSSQPQSQASQLHMMSQTYSQSQSHVPAFPSSLSNEFKPGETSTPRTANEPSHINLAERRSQVTSGLSPSQIEDENVQGSTDEPNTSHKARAFAVEDNQIYDQLPSSPSPPTKSGQRLCKTEQGPCQRKVVVCPPMDNSFATREGDTVHGGEELSEDDAETHAALCQGLFSTPATIEPVAADRSDGILAGSPSPYSMHSLFSTSSAPGSRGRLPSLESTNRSPELLPAPDFTAPPHDPEIWKNPSFLRSKKGGEEETSTTRVQRKHRLSEQSMPPQKRMKVGETSNLEDSAPRQPATVKTRPRAPRQPEKTTEGMKDLDEGRLQRGIGRSTDDGRSSRFPSRDLTIQSLSSQREGNTSLPRLDGLAVDLMSTFHDSAHSHFRTTWGELQGILLRTGRIRTLGEKVARDASVYLNKD